MIKLCKAMSIIWFWAAILSAQTGIEPNSIERVGQSGWQFLKINGDARQAGMAGSYSALAHGNANAIFGNPASLTDVRSYDLQFNSNQWIADISHSSLAMAYSYKSWGSFGLSIVSLDYGEIAETVNASVDGGVPSAVITGRYFTASDFAAGLSYARNVTDKLSIGGNLRWIKQKIDELSVDNWSFDIGTLYYTGYRSLRLAMVARNFGPDANLVGWSEKYQSEAFDIRMPIDFRLGLAMDFFESASDPHFLTVTFEGDHPNDGTEKVHLGFDYTYRDLFSLRGGYRMNYDTQGLTLGAGFRYPVLNHQLSLDYAYLDFGVLNAAHIISIGFSAL